MEFELNKKCVRTIGKVSFTEFRFDFPKENGNAKVKIDLVYPTPEEYKYNIVTDTTERKRVEIFCGNFQPCKEYKSVIIENLGTYIIPKFYNKEMLKLNDEKTWSMVFISIFQDEISKARKEAVEYMEIALEYNTGK